MENNFVFRTLEVTGNTKEEALESAPFNVPVDRWVNATQAFNNWQEKQTGAITEAAIKEFKVNYLASKKISAAYIVKKAAVKDSRKRPYKIEDVKREGATKTGKVFQLIEDGTGRVLAETKVKMVPQVDKDGNKILDADGNVRMKVSSETKAAAKELAKKLIMEDGFRGKGRARLTKQVVDGEDTVFTFEYAPSTSTQVGVYDVFGYETL